MYGGPAREQRVQRPIKLPIWSFWVGLAPITKYESYQLNRMKFLSQRCAVSFWVLSREDLLNIECQICAIYLA